jgi:hypothetical protein
MRFRQGGRELEVDSLELRHTLMPNGVDTLRFHVPPASLIDPHASAVLEDETGDIRVVVMEYHPDTGQVIAWSRPQALPPPAPPIRKKRSRK